jgi:solute carrier family 25 protein 16
MSLPGAAPTAAAAAAVVPQHDAPALPLKADFLSPTMKPSTKEQLRQKHDPPLCPTDDESVLPARKQRHSPDKAIDKRSLDYVLRSGIAGGLAGCAAKTVVGPLDRVKILFQASNPQYAKYSGTWFGFARAMRDIYSVDGSRGLFRGHSATLLRIFPYAGIKFLAYEQIRNVMIKGPEQEVPWRRFMSGSLAGEFGS